MTRWITIGGLTLAALLTALAVALWPASNTEQARSDGEALGAAVTALDEADTAAEVDAALLDVRDAAADTRAHAGDAVADQVDDQADALSRAVDGFTGIHQSGDEFEADLYQYELDMALEDLDENAAGFRAEGPEVQQAFWEGYQTAA